MTRLAALPLATRRGRRAEQLAREFIVRANMQLIACNVRVGYLEIDIIARDGPHIVIVEVRGRSSSAWQGALSSISYQKKQRLRRAGAILWARRWHQQTSLRGVRFDVVAVDLDATPPHIEHLRAAF